MLLENPGGVLCDAYLRHHRDDQYAHQKTARLLIHLALLQGKNPNGGITTRKLAAKLRQRQLPGLGNFLSQKPLLGKSFYYRDRKVLTRRLAPVKEERRTQL